MVTSFITVRTSSLRLPGKCFLKFGDYSVLEHIVCRAKQYNLKPIICTSQEKEDQTIIDLATKLNIDCYAGSLNNKIKRWKDCCEKLSINSFHTLDADDPFFCGEEIHRSFELLKKGYDVVTPTPSSSNGGATVGYSLTKDILIKVSDKIDENTNTEMIMPFLKQIKDIKIAKLDDPDNSVINQRMTLDYPEDYEKLLKVLEIVGPMATRQEVYNCLKQNSELDKINSFRNNEWKQNQLNQSIK
jgi:spore coat polysaccharide biosynthesis protein SpsF (cytidylyltransferase family)